MTELNSTQVLVLSCLGTLFLRDFSPGVSVCWAVTRPVVTRCQAGLWGTGLTTHTLYIELTPGPRTPQSDTTHSQDKVASAHNPLIAHVPHSTSGDLKWSRDLIFSNLFWSAKTFVIHLMCHVTPNCLVICQVLSGCQWHHSTQLEWRQNNKRITRVKSYLFPAPTHQSQWEKLSTSRPASAATRSEQSSGKSSPMSTVRKRWEIVCFNWFLIFWLSGQVSTPLEPTPEPPSSRWRESM